MRINVMRYKAVFIALVVFSILSTALTQCKTKEALKKKVPVTDFAAESKRLKNLVTKNVTQRFTFKTTKQIVAKGSNGTVLTIDPKNLETEVGGEVMGKEIGVELIELANRYDLITADAQTISNGKLLVSGGAYWIRISSEGKDLKIKKGKSIKAEFPKLSDDEMKLFYGQRDSLEQMNWLETSVLLRQRNNASSIARSEFSVIEISLDDLDTIYYNVETTQTTEQESLENQNLRKKLYQAVELEQLGWINVDRFYEMTNKRDLQFAFNPQDSVTSAIVYLVFEDLNSVLTTTYFVANDTVLNNVFRQIPSEGKVKLIGVTIKDKKIFASRTLLDLRSRSDIVFELAETTEEGLIKLFN
ncbi:hypothetical protein [Chryseosolibacter indicus]|uniref:Uncharacterized protein n=1 Tax=Chryseosolibacter indicus TaxID=2782351 RepID=A0ABS5VYT9_9BACT|nr:hypothetical protein [Chryseosolibacter indicus]MBT1706025.1 hypothetical protein [Chryseosolibacter indicus]